MGIWFGKDGTLYNSYNEKIQADIRYTQMERLIQAQEQQFKLHNSVGINTKLNSNSNEYTKGNQDSYVSTASLVRGSYDFGDIGRFLWWSYVYLIGPIGLIITYNLYPTVDAFIQGTKYGGIIPSFFLFSGICSIIGYTKLIYKFLIRPFFK